MLHLTIRQLHLLSILCFGCWLAFSGDQTAWGDEVTPIRKFAGVSRQDDLRQLAPESGMIVSESSLQKIWRAWGINDPQPRVDFDRQLVLVATVDGPNRTFATPLKLEQGALTYSVASTKMAGPGFGYLMMVVPREGIQTVNGKAIPEAKEERDDNRPEVADQIKVQVTGTVNTGVMAIGGETTGYTIESGGVTWELDFQTAQQVQTAKMLESSNTKARINGTLNRVAGVEVQQRFIVWVDQILPATHTDAAAERNQTAEPAVDQNSSRNNRFQAPDRDGQADNLQEVPRRPMEGSQSEVDTRPTPTVDPSSLNGFQSIKIDMEGGAFEGKITQRVSREGKAVIGEGNEQQSYEIPADRLVNVHSHIKRTDWAKVPRVSRGIDPNASELTVEIQTPGGANIYRIFLTADRIKDVPEIQVLFRLLQKGD